MASLAKPHAVLVPFPAQGHINPLMQLATKLVARGVHVTLILIDYHLARISQHRINGFPSGIRLMSIPDGLPADSSRDVMDSPLAISVQQKGGVFETALQSLLAEISPVTCIIGDYFVARVRDIANRLDIPRVLFWPQSAASFTIYEHTREIASNGFNPFEGSVKTFGPKLPMNLITCIPGLSPMHPADLPFETSFGLPALQWTEKWIGEQTGSSNEAFRVISNSVEELEPEICRALPNLRPIGPLLPSAFLEERDHSEDVLHAGTSVWKEDDCTQWLDKQPVSSVLYISFGSLTKFAIEQIQEVAFGLIASGQRFLWVIREGSVRGLGDVSNVLEAFHEGFVDGTRDRGKIISWAPQALVLAHPALSGFFSHCGWNSTIESISMGVPLLAWPQLFDQITNCWLIANKWKIGLQLRTDEENKTTRREVERAVRELMEGEAAEELKRKVLELRDVARKAVKADSGSSEGNLQALVQDLFQRARMSSLKV